MQSSLQSHVLPFTFLLLLLLLPLLSESQLPPSESKTLFDIQKQLQYPHILQSWTSTANFCNLPSSPSFRVLCSKGHITELTITGNRTSKLSGRFEELFTLLTKLPSLNTLSLTSLGISGPLSPKIITKIPPSLQSLNLSSNFISGNIPKEISSLKNLKSLVLTDNLLNGSVFDLRGLSNLQELDLGGNNLGPELPSLPSNLISVSLKNNSFRSKLSEQIKKMNKLQSLDLSSNEFTGSIPEVLFSLPSLQTLSFAQNMFSGSLPNSTCSSSKVRTLDVSHNLLTGKLPSCYSSKSFKNQTVLFSFNCLSLNGTPNAKYQRPLSFCQNQASKAVAVEPVPKVEEKDSARSKLGLVILVIIGVVILAAILVVSVLIILRRRRSESEEDTFEVNNNNNDRHASDKASVCSNTTTSTKSLPDSRRVPQTMRSAVIGLPPYYMFSLEELEEATNDFDAASLLCEQLYRGRLREGIAVTVRCIKLKQKSLPQSLAQQMEVLSKLRHMHLVSVLGHCIASNQGHNQHAGHTIFIVQEYISNGSLKDFLTDCRKKEVLQWPQRMAIAIGVARGIQFLHMGVAPGIFGNNLDIENILLDGTLTVKISGYTIPLPSKVGAESHQVKTPKSNEDGEKEDVYQFGVILLQIITGKVVAAFHCNFFIQSLFLKSSTMEFWGVEVLAGKSVKVKPDFETLIHVSQASLDKGKKGETALLYVTVDKKKLVLGTLSQGNIPQTSFDLVFEKEFELSHSLESGSVHFVGYKSPNMMEEEDDFSDSEEEEEEEAAVPAAVAANGGSNVVVKADSRPKVTLLEAKPESDEEDDDESDEEDGSEEDGSDSEKGMDVDEDDSEDEEEDDSEEEETPKKKPEVSNKKRPNESASKTPISAKKAKPATPHPAKKGGKSPNQSPKSGGQSSGAGSNKKQSNSGKQFGSNNKGKGKGKGRA